MSFYVLDKIWDPEAEANADWFDATPGIIVLLDGAAPLCKEERVSTLDNDAVWLVRRFAEHFAGAEVSAGDGIAERVERVRAQLHEEYSKLCRSAGFTPTETPFSCLSIAHDAGASVEFFNMGDVTTLIRNCDSTITRFGESTVRELDRQALACLKREISKGVEPHSARLTNVWPRILSNRALRNVLSGYDVLDANVSCVNHLERLSSRRHEVRDVLMMSDGFYRLVDTYGRYTDAALFEAVERVGLSELLAELRHIEIEDSPCKKYPRFKQHDDATALWFELKGES